MLRTSILPRLSRGPLRPRARARRAPTTLLERVAQANLFLVALDEEGEWFRYQALFAEYASALLEPGAAAGLHRRAADWFRERGLIEDAVEQYAAAGDDRAIAELIETHHLALARAGRAATIEHWIGALPRDLLTARPGLLTAGMLAAGGSALPRDEALRLLVARRSRARGRPGGAGRRTTRRPGCCCARSTATTTSARRSTCARSALAAARADASELEVVAISLLAFTLLLAGSAGGRRASRARRSCTPRRRVSPYAHVGALATRALAAVVG